MYDAYALMLLGTALHQRDARYLAIAVESLILLNGLEARVENRR
ncbi:MAG TPA: hypothetical protein VGW38_09905 [Chloroflexota bacterium]|nr:hypothetical protein [Chloroflexota bacterium]